MNIRVTKATVTMQLITQAMATITALATSPVLASPAQRAKLVTLSHCWLAPLT